MHCCVGSCETNETEAKELTKRNLLAVFIQALHVIKSLVHNYSLTIHMFTATHYSYEKNKKQAQHKTKHSLNSLIV
jgi:heterodisulfide reductase subunit B